MSHRLHSCAFAVLLVLVSCTAAAFQSHILINDLPGADPSVGTWLLDAFRKNGLEAKGVMAKELLPALSNPSREKMLILTDCGILPLSVAKPLDEYLEKGGRLIALGGTLFRVPIAEIDGKWITQRNYQDQLSKAPLQHTIEDFSKSAGPGVELLGLGWSRSSNDTSHPSTHEVVIDPVHGPCLHRIIRDLNGWDTFYSPPLVQPIPEGQHYTCFWAKGGPRTGRLLLEWEEKDGSRWMGVVELTPKWKRYVLSEKDFAFWESIPARAKTQLNLTNAARFNVGLAATHTGGLSGDHEFWITGIGTCGDTGIPAIDWHVEFRPREMLYPTYHSYVCTGVDSITTSWKQVLVRATGAITVPNEVYALHPRPQSTGYNKQRNHRWIPLIDAWSGGDFRGTVAALRFTPNTEQMWAAFAIQDSIFYKQRSIRDKIVRLTARMQDSVFLWEGGASKYTYFPGERISIGASVAADAIDSETLSLELMEMDFSWHLDTSEGPLYGTRTIWSKDVPAEPSEVAPIVLETAIPKRELEPYVSIALYRNGKVIDAIRHDIHEWEADPAVSAITVEKGDFCLNGKPWFPYGVNYMPSSGIAREEWEPFEHWLGPRGYDPEIVARDLWRIKEMGMNMVSVFLHHESHACGNLIDFLRQCEELGLRVNLSLRPGTPLDFEWDKIREMIEENRLASNKTVFAYDLAWEPHFEGYEDRSWYTKEWNEWIGRKHGGLDAAFKAWDCRTNLVDGLFPVPQSKQWYESGPWDHMALDYGDFLNDLLHKHYSRARELVRSIDPNHAVSFRMQYSGDPTYWGPTWIPYDFRGVANAVDIFEPEGYGRLEDWEQVKPGRFTVDYARAVKPDLPVFWAEAGMHSWDIACMHSTSRNEERVAEFYRDFHRMLIDSHSNGVAWWWYPGGFRANENSDYGIINPDGTDRPATCVIRELGPQVQFQGPRPEPEVIIDLDMTTRPGGLAGVYAKVKDEYWAAIDAGKTVGLRIP